MTSPPPSPASPDDNGSPVEIVIGEIVGPHGHRGEVKIYPRTDFPDRLLDLEEITLRLPDGKDQTYPVQNARWHKNVILMQLGGVLTMNDAEALRGAKIVISREERHELPDEDTFYVDDLVGLRVVTDAGQELGTIRNVLRYPANDVFDLGNNLLIPATEEVVLEVDLDEGVMVIHPIPGLLDEPEVV
ncbi:MAG: ribosome maturation factor RimM [Armatimonadetes bacterium]|nr:ribosome maturation factor RimM [Armatimonadota bacterium]